MSKWYDIFFTDKYKKEEQDNLEKMNKRDNIRNQKRNQRNKELQSYKNENYNSIIPLLQEYFEEIKNNNESCILNLMYDLINKFIRENKALKLISNLEEILGEIPKNPFHDMIWINFDTNVEELGQELCTLIRDNKTIDYIYIEINWFTINYWWDLHIQWIKWDGYKNFNQNFDENSLFENYETIIVNNFDLLFWANEDENEFFTTLCSDYIDAWNKNLVLQESFQICELLIILRVNQLLEKSLKLVENINIPIYINAHDYSFTNLVNKKD